MNRGGLPRAPGARSLLLLAGVLPGCREEAPADPATEPAAEVLVGFSLAGGAPSLCEEIYREASSAGTKVRVLEAYGRTTAQEDQVSDLLQVPVSSLVIFPVGPLTLERVRDAAGKREVPLVVVGRGARPQESSVTLSTAVHAATTGRSLAAELQKHHVSQPRIAVVEDARWGTGSSGWTDGVLEGLGQVFPSLQICCRLQIVPGDEGRASLHQALSESPVDVVLADEDTTPTAVALLGEGGSATPLLVGVLLRSGTETPATPSDSRFRMLVFATADVAHEALECARAVSGESSAARRVEVAAAALPYPAEEK